MILAPPKAETFPGDLQGQIATNLFAEIYPLNILIADDNFINQKLIERILRKLGYQTDTACNGIQVLDFMAKKQYNVILMDIRMPEMDGFEAMQNVRQMTMDQPYIVAMTANALPSDREECLQSGMNDYIAKPIYMNDIVEILKNAAKYLSVRG
jgi:CheY-like chemotaxis protein